MSHNHLLNPNIYEPVANFHQKVVTEAFDKTSPKTNRRSKPKCVDPLVFAKAFNQIPYQIEKE